MLSPSAHVDPFARNQLPPPAQWPHFTFDLPELAYPQRLNCASTLLAGGEPGRRCLVTPTGSLTYGELHQLSARIARVLAEDMGLVPGNRVLLRSPNNELLVACWLGALRAGLVVVTTMPLLRVMELQAVGEIARIDLSLVDDRFQDELTEAAIAPCLPFSELRDRLARKAPDFADVATAADDVALLAFTSGSTGRPKATMHFHRDVLAIADTFSRHVLRPRADDLFAGSPPLGFTFGLGGLLVFPMRAGASALLLERGTTDVLSAALSEFQPSVLFTAPTAYRVLADQVGHLPALRRCVSAGEPLPASTWTSWREATGVSLIDGLGTTEMLHVFVSASDGDIRPGATGRAVPGYQVRVQDDRGREVPPGVAGTLAVRGPTGCRYLADPRQAEYVRDGWNLTGDVCVRDGDGYLWYQARNDDMIITSGFNVAGPEVENALMRHPDVRECGVVGVPDPERTMTVKAYVVLREGAEAGAGKAEELRAHCRSLLAAYKAPREVEFLTALPRTSTGKTQRYRLRDRADR